MTVFNKSSVLGVIRPLFLLSGLLSFSLPGLIQAELPSAKATTSGSRNINAGISLATRPVNSEFPFQHQRGAGMLVGVWDAGSESKVRADHQEFTENGFSRVVNMGSMAAYTNYDDHATHVSGTIAAAGVLAAAEGMAPNAVVWAFDMNEDGGLIPIYAASTANSPTNLYVSNHSYGPDFGWAYNSSEGRVEWTGPADTNAFHFGMYTDTESTADDWAYKAPYHLAFFATGNSRTDSAETMQLSDGDTFYRTSDQETYTETIYHETNAPLGNDWWFDGMGTVCGGAVAKNILSVGAVDAAVINGMRVLAQSTMSSFSDWGPTDDGRIKPDLVADGVDMLSVGIASTNAYTVMSGTSMATPAACGASALLQQMYHDLYGSYMRADTLKTLLLHTADDVDAPGPDYRTGWGLMDTAAAACMIQKQFDHATTLIMTNQSLDATPGSSNTYTFTYSGVGPIKATISWIDPAATGQEGFGYNTNPVLVHDLDIRLYSPDDTEYRPYILDPVIPTNYATTGDNFRDNVEQILVAQPSKAGTWTLVVAHKGTLTNNQIYALALSGARVLSDTPVFSLLGPGHQRIDAMNTEIPFLTTDSSTTMTFTVYNEDSEKLTVQPPICYGSSTFSLPNAWSAASNLTPGDAISFDVTYTPDVSSDQNEAQLLITHNGTNSSPFVCRLEGEFLNVDGSETVLTNGNNFLQHTITQTTGTIANMRIGLTMSADDMQYIYAVLISPDQAETILFNTETLSGKALDNTTFDSKAFLSITNENISSPYRYTYLPENSLDAFRGLPTTGTWTLVVYKGEGIVNAAVENWWISFDTVSSEPTLSISDNAFYESPLADGTFTNTLQLTISNATFGVDAANAVTVTNLPVGLTATVQRVSDSILSLNLTGTMSDRAERTHPYLNYAPPRSRDGHSWQERIDFSLLTCSPYTYSNFAVTPTNAIEIAADGGSATITVTAPPALIWTASSAFTPLSWNTSTHQLGDGNVQFSVSRNDTTNSRTGTLLIGNQLISFTQDPGTPIASLNGLMLLLLE